MPRIIGLTATTLILALLLAAIAACGSDEPTPRSNGDQATQTPTSEMTPSPQAQQDQAPQREASTPSPDTTGTPHRPAQSPASTPDEKSRSAHSTTTPVQENTPQAPAKPGATESAAAVPPTPETETGGICARTPAVKEAILAALDMQSCSAVEDSHLATVTSLDIASDRISPEDVAGLTAITDIKVQLFDGLDAHLANLTTLRNAHITFHLAQMPFTYPLPEDIAAPWRIPDDFLPHQDEFAYWPGSPSTSSKFDNLRFTILPGLYPGYLSADPDAPESPSGYGSLATDLVASNWAATNVHINETVWWDYPDWRSVPSLAIPQMEFWNITHLTIEFDVKPLDADSSPSDIRASGTIDDRGTNSLISLKIVNLNPDAQLELPENYISRPMPENNIPELTVEIRGLIGDVDSDAFRYAAMKELHLDLNEGREEHTLYFDRLIRRPKEGSGWK